MFPQKIDTVHLTRYFNLFMRQSYRNLCVVISGSFTPLFSFYAFSASVSRVLGLVTQKSYFVAFRPIITACSRDHHVHILIFEWVVFWIFSTAIFSVTKESVQGIPTTNSSQLGSHDFAKRYGVRL